MGNLGWEELLLIAVVILVLFGSRKIPEFMRGLGHGIREFNNAKNNVQKELHEGMKEKDVQKNTAIPETEKKEERLTADQTGEGTV